jgi:hypothetical protein
MNSNYMRGYMSKKATQNVRLVRRLATGKNLTVDEAVNRLGIQSLSARIHEFRTVGFVIYTNKVRQKSKRNKTRFVTAYRLSVDSSTKKMLTRFNVN